jgi:pSer/pThr/pTyr-binding forkhead associated (FHA) protein
MTRSLAPTIPGKTTPPRLIVDGVSNWVFSHDLSRETPCVIGRRSKSDICLSHTEVSAMHARVSWDGDKTRIEDLQSSNFTFVNDVRVTEQRVLKDGDVIRIGPYSISFHDASAPGSPTPTLSRQSVDELLAARRKTREAAEEKVAADEKLNEQLDKAQSTLKGIQGKKEHETLQSPAAGKALQAELKQAIEALEEAKRVNQAHLSHNRLLRVPLVASDEGDCFRGMIEIARQSIEAEVAFLMFINPETNRWEIKCHAGKFDDLIASPFGGAANQRPPISLTLAEHAVREKKAMLTDQLPSSEAEGGASLSIVRNKISTGVAAPIFAGGMQAPEVIGCLYFDRREEVKKRFGARDAAEVAAMAGLFADVMRFWELRDAE